MIAQGRLTVCDKCGKSVFEISKGSFYGNIEDIGFHNISSNYSNVLCDECYKKFNLICDTFLKNNIKKSNINIVFNEGQKNG